MKSVLVLLPLLFALNAKADLKPFISEQDKNKMLQILDDVCGDSWCEGQYEIDFKSMLCTNDGCTVNMDLDLGTDEDFEHNPAPRFFEASIYLKKTPAFLAQLSSDSFKHNFLTAAFNAEVDKAMDAIVTGSAMKTVKAPQGLQKPLALNNDSAISALLGNILAATEGEAHQNDLQIYFHSYKEVCSVKNSSLECNFNYLADRWNGEMHVSFKIQDNHLTQIQSLKVEGNY